VTRTRYVLHSLALIVICIGMMGAQPSADTRFTELGHRLMCKCGCGQVLLECNHVGCPYSEGMRNELTAGIERGDSDDLVLQGFVQKYGSTVLAAPTTSGFNRVAWIMPFVALFSGLTLVTFIVRKWKFKVAPVGAQNLSPEELDDFRRKAREETEE
jgi:cytochrome c-type biogenesis protein CcmH/NrfF